jgi:hypothetical protein
MVIRVRVVQPNFELTVCGPPTPEWLEWLRTTNVPLTAGQKAWRDGRFPALHEPPTAPRARPRRAPKPAGPVNTEETRASKPVDLVDTEEL